MYRLSSGWEDAGFRKLGHSVTFWDPATGKQINSYAHFNKVRTVSFSPDGKVLASGSDDHSIQVWDTVNMKLLAKLTGHSGGVLDLAFSPDGKMLASGSGDKTVKLWAIQPHDN